MTLEADTHEAAHRVAVTKYRKARLLSFAIFLSVVALLYTVLVYVGIVAFAGVLFLGMMLLMTPLGNAYTAATVWAGTWVSSCPYCPMFSFEDAEIKTHECTHCGKIEGEVTGVLGGGWTTSHSNGDVVAEYCSWDCRNAAKANGGESA